MKSNKPHSSRRRRRQQKQRQRRSYRFGSIKSQKRGGMISRRRVDSTLYASTQRNMKHTGLPLPPPQQSTVLGPARAFTEQPIAITHSNVTKHIAFNPAIYTGLELDDGNEVVNDDPVERDDRMRQEVNRIQQYFSTSSAGVQLSPTDSAFNDLLLYLDNQTVSKKTGYITRVGNVPQYFCGNAEALETDPNQTVIRPNYIVENKQYAFAVIWLQYDWKEFGKDFRPPMSQKGMVFRIASFALLQISKMGELYIDVICGRSDGLFKRSGLVLLQTIENEFKRCGGFDRIRFCALNNVEKFYEKQKYEYELDYDGQTRKKAYENGKLVCWYMKKEMSSIDPPPEEEVRYWY